MQQQFEIKYEQVRLKSYIIRTLRNGRKTKTIVEGLEDDIDFKFLAKCLRRELKCSAAHKKDTKNNMDVIILSGDVAQVVGDWLVREGLARKDELKYRGV